MLKEPKKRMPAEWENPVNILITYPGRNTDWDYILEEARNQFDGMIESLLEGGEKVWLITDGEISPELREKILKGEGRIFDNIPYNDTWTRDYGFITIEENGNYRLLDFGFNGWGLKFAADKDNLVNLELVKKGYVESDNYLNCRDFTLEGGSIESDGKGTILTTASCLCSPNRNGGLTEEEAENVLKNRLGAQRVLWLHHGFLEGDDTDSHIDTLARIAPDDTILYVAPPKNSADIHYAELCEMEKELKTFLTSDGKPFRTIPLPFPDPIYDEDGYRLPATYANYLVTGNNLYLPVYNQPENDKEALESIKKAFPNHKIYTVNCLTLIKQHGSLHCSTMQMYQNPSKQ